MNKTLRTFVLVATTLFLLCCFLFSGSTPPVVPPYIGPEIQRTLNRNYYGKEVFIYECRSIENETVTVFAELTAVSTVTGELEGLDKLHAFSIETPNEKTTIHLVVDKLSTPEDGVFQYPPTDQFVLNREKELKWVKQQYEKQETK